MRCFSNWTTASVIPAYCFRFWYMQLITSKKVCTKHPTYYFRHTTCQFGCGLLISSKWRRFHRTALGDWLNSWRRQEFHLSFWRHSSCPHTHHLIGWDWDNHFEYDLYASIQSGRLPRFQTNKCRSNLVNATTILLVTWPKDWRDGLGCEAGSIMTSLSPGYEMKWNYVGQDVIWYIEIGLNYILKSGQKYNIKLDSSLETQ